MSRARPMLRRGEEKYRCQELEMNGGRGCPGVLSSGRAVDVYWVNANNFFVF